MSAVKVPLESVSRVRRMIEAPAQSNLSNMKETSQIIESGTVSYDATDEYAISCGINSLYRSFLGLLNEEV